MVLPLSKSQWRILIKLKINLSGDPAIPVLGICPISYAQILYMLHRYLLSKVHCCPIHNSQEMEQAKWSSTDEWANDNGNAVHISSGILFNCKENWWRQKRFYWMR